MKKYAIIEDNETKRCSVGVGTNTDYYESIGMVEMDVEQAYNGEWYVEGYAPEKPKPTHEQTRRMREKAYCAEVDPITCHINRLKDEEQTEEIQAEIAKLIAERAIKVEEIKQRYPYQEEGK